MKKQSKYMKAQQCGAITLAKFPLTSFCTKKKALTQKAHRKFLYLSYLTLPKWLKITHANLLLHGIVAHKMQSSDYILEHIGQYVNAKVDIFGEFRVIVILMKYACVLANERASDSSGLEVKRQFLYWQRACVAVEFVTRQ